MRDVRRLNTSVLTCSQCDGRIPVCSPCSRRGTECSYTDIDHRRNKLKRSETDALQLQLRELQNVIATLRLGSEEDAIDLLMRIRSQPPATLTPSETPLAINDTLDEWRRSQERDVQPTPDPNPSVRSKIA